MRVILFGPPGAGKGTQSRLLCERNHLECISTGEILRAAKANRTPVGELARPYMQKGELVPDDIVNKLVAERFRPADRPTRFIMDGYPRTVAQARTFDALLESYGLPVTSVIVLHVDDDELIRRLRSRQRSDDSEETVRARLAVHHREVAEVVPYYRPKGIVHELQGIGSIEQIYANILKFLEPDAGISTC